MTLHRRPDRSRTLQGLASLAGDVPPVVVPGESPGALLVRLRMLSAETLLCDSWGRLLWIPEAVLSAAVPLFVGAALKVDHDRSVLATVGRVASAEWSPATEGSPAGIDGVAEVHRAVSEDAETIARLMEQRLISAVSSGFSAEWEPSHPDLPEETWWTMYGLEVDGRVVCEVATKICKVHEVSTVDAGGDPNSRRLAAPVGGRSMNEKSFVAALLALMGLPAETAMDELLGAVGKVLRGESPEAKKPEEAPAAMPEGAPAEAAAQLSGELVALCAILTPEGSASPLTPLAAMEEALRLRTVQPPIVDIALSEGRCTPAEAKIFRTMEGSAPVALKALLASRPKNSAVPLGAPQAGQQASDVALSAVVDLTPQQKAAAERFGLKNPARIAEFAPQG